MPFVCALKDEYLKRGFGKKLVCCHVPSLRWCQMHALSGAPAEIGALQLGDRGTVCAAWQPNAILQGFSSWRSLQVCSATLVQEVRRQRKAEAQEARAAEKTAKEEKQRSSELRSYSSLMQVGKSVGRCHCQSAAGGVSLPQ